MSTMPCGMTLRIPRRSCIARPFSVFFSQLGRIDSSVADFNRTQVQLIPVKRILGPDPRRVAIHLNTNIGAAAAILISTVETPGSYLQCFVSETNGGRLINFPPRVYSYAALYAAVESFAAFVPDALILSGFEFVEA